MSRRGKLKQFAESFKPGVVVVEPWVLRRIVRLDGRVQGFGQLHARRETYPIQRNRLLALVDSRELGVTSPGDMPERLVVLAEPEDLDLGDHRDDADLLGRLAPPLFHACIYLELEEHFARQPAPELVVAQRRAQLGETVFAEIRAVLFQDERLFFGASDIDVYVEFVASYLELSFFAPEALGCHFPGVRDRQVVNTIVRQDVDYQAIYDRLPVRAGGADERAPEEPPAAIKPAASSGSIALAEFRQVQMRAERAAAMGNQVRSALLHANASMHGPPALAAEEYAAARAELATLAQRLCAALDLPADQAADWAHALEPLLGPACDRLASVESRLLDDLEKACVEHERQVHRTSVWRWILSRGKRPYSRPLPLLSNALCLRHLQRAQRRLSSARVAARCCQQLRTLLAGALTLVETRTRQRLRQIINAVFEEIGLLPENVPERVAREKMAEELIDGILERGYMSMADLRDAISKNDLKLPDVTGLGNFLRGDRLLKADRACSDALEGVYRSGAIYQRWPQMLSSLAFGTPTGRFLTRFVAVPYGGAYLALEFLNHLGRLLLLEKNDVQALVQQVPTQPIGHGSPDWLFVAAVLCLGTWISMLVHRPAFRAWNLRVCQACGRHARKWLVDFPVSVIRSRFVQFILSSYAFGVLQDYFLQPAALTALLALLAHSGGLQLSNRFWLEVALVAALFLNSTLGRFVVEVTNQYLGRVWRDLRIHVIGSFLQWIVDVFRGLVSALERLINLIDELLRLRMGSGRLVRTCKMLGGIVWSVVAYVLVFVFTLLVEPQINPIKHFPVVTVSHKLILPTGPAIVQKLSPVLGGPLANTLVWSTIWLVPGAFGFLVWELKENWRLYGANRPRYVRAEIVGSHGEKMLRLLRPGFHSGTLPRAFAALRRAVQRGEPSSGKRSRRKWATIRRVELDVQRFVTRELLSLLSNNGFLSGAPISVLAVRTSTNQVDVELSCDAWPGQPVTLAWAYIDGVLSGRVSQSGWIGHLTQDDLTTFAAAVSGLFQRTGVQETDGPLPLTVTPPFAWTDWVRTWQAEGVR